MLFEEGKYYLLLNGFINTFEGMEVLLMFLTIYSTNLMARGRKLINSLVNVEYQMIFVFRNS